jgi:hypothetical protein
MTAYPHLPLNVNYRETIPYPPVIDINGGMVDVYPFTLPASKKFELYLEQVSERPDFTLRAWISKMPMDDVVEAIAGIQHFKIPKLQIKLWLSDNIETNEQYYCNYQLNSGQEYYLNIQNLENTSNRYEIAFIDPDDSIPLPEEPTDITVEIDEPALPVLPDLSVFIPKRN